MSAAHVPQAGTGAAPLRTGRAAAEVRRALESLSGASVRAARDGRLWTLRGEQGSGERALRVEVRLDERWLILDASLPGCGARSARALLTHDARLPDELGLVRVAGAARPRLRAELRVDAGDLGARLERIWRAFLNVNEPNGGARGAPSAEKSGTDALSTESSRARIERCARALSEAGWTFSERADGHLAIDLEVPDGYGQARLDASSHGAARLAVDLPRPASADGACAEALAELLLRCAGWVRGVRASADPDPRLEVRLSGACPEVELGEALCSLSVALRFTGEEAALLARDADAARLFLACGRDARRRRAPRDAARPASADPTPTAETCAVGV